jgi:hypothetical protein
MLMGVYSTLIEMFQINRILPIWCYMIAALILVDIQTA